MLFRSVRTAHAAGVDAVLCTSGTVEMFNGKVIRSSAGSLFHVPVVQSLDADDLLASLHAAGVASYGLAGSGATSLFDLDDDQLSRPTAWWLGSEAHGLPVSLVRSMQPVSIPMPGGTESLNVAVAAALALYADRKSTRLNSSH